MPIIDINPPGAEPISLPYAKTFLRVETDAEDSLISDLIMSARQQVERRIGISLISRRQLYSTDRLSDSGVFINHTPVTVVHSVTSYDVPGAATELLPTHYTVNLNAIPAHICLADRLRWAQFGDGAATVSIEIDAGFGSEPEDIPTPLRQACLLLLARGYEDRGSYDSRGVPALVDALLEPYRSVKL